jgi:hypothetical protein
MTFPKWVKQPSCFLKAVTLFFRVPNPDFTGSFYLWFPDPGLEAGRQKIQGIASGLIGFPVILLGTLNRDQGQESRNIFYPSPIYWGQVKSA